MDATAAVQRLWSVAAEPSRHGDRRRGFSITACVVATNLTDRRRRSPWSLPLPGENHGLMPSPFKPPASPLIYRMAAHVAPLPKRGIEEVHKSIVNRLRRYSGTPIADLTLQMLWNPPIGEAEELRSAPWLTLLLVKWAMQDNLVSLRVGPPIPSAEFDRLRQELRELQGPSHGEKPNVWLMLRYLVHVQVEFQRRESWGFLRWPALYARLPSGSINRRQFRQVMGLEPDPFLDLAYALYAAVLARKMPLGSDYLSPFRPKHGAAVERVYELFVRDLRESASGTAIRRCSAHSGQAGAVRVPVPTPLPLPAPS